MTRLSQKQGRKNSAGRKRKVTVPHALAGHWKARPQPMMRSGTVGLPRLIDKNLRILKVHLPYHESDHVLNLAYNVLCGGTRLEDIERLRHDTAYMNALGADLIPDPTTAGDFGRRFDDQQVSDLMECINEVRPKLWRGRGRQLLGPIAYLDTDGTIIETYGEQKNGMDISYKGVWGYAPLTVWSRMPSECVSGVIPISP